MPQPDPEFAKDVARVAANRSRLNALCACNLPLLDAAQLVAGRGLALTLLSRECQIDRSPQGGTRASLTLPTRRFDRLAELVQFLEKEHQDRYWYRGQGTVYQATYAGRQVGQSTQYKFEAMIPSSFRAYTRSSPADWTGFRIPLPLDEFAPPLRAMWLGKQPELNRLASVFLDSAIEATARIGLIGMVNLDFGEELLAPGTSLSKDQMKLVSLAQHYEYSSVMVDISRSIDVAVWFATRDWKTGAVAGSRNGGPGAIYRFDSSQIGKMMNELRKEDKGALVTIPNLGAFGSTDIHDQFTHVAMRPSSQEGGSLLGMENFSINVLLKHFGAIEAFHFDHASVTGNETPQTKDTIQPPDDPALATFWPKGLQVDGQPITPSELRAFLDMHDPQRRDHMVNLRENRLI
jgi:hypothetical protein